MPEWAFYAAYAPFSALLPRLSLLIHHGGIGTSAQALAAGIPQTIVPFAHDQFDNAARLRRLGVSSTLASTATVARWISAIDGLGMSAAVRAYAERMAGQRTAAAAIALRLENMARSRRAT